MSEAPSSPSEFFGNYLPGWFARTPSAPSTSAGALVFHVGDETYALRLAQGVLQVSRKAADDALLQVSLSPTDFAEFVRQGAPLFADGRSDRVLALRALSLDAERAKLLRNADGSVAFELTDGECTRTLLLSPGACLAGDSAPACTLRAAADDFWALSRGEKNPFELLMDGKVRIQGRMEVALAMSSVLLA